MGIAAPLSLGGWQELLGIAPGKAAKWAAIDIRERVMAMTPGRVLHPHPMPRDLESKPGRTKPTRGRKLRDHFVELEREIIHEALERAAGNKSKAARELGMAEQTLRYRLKKLFPEGRKNLRTRK